MDKIELEKDFPRYARGGFISYVELPRMVNNLEGLESVITYTLERSPYYGVNTCIDACFECNFKGDTIIEDYQFTCPSCGNTNPDTMNVIKRVSGYLGAPQNRPWPAGKLKETKLREKNK